MHKKVGVGRFACISAEDGVDYVFIQYADAMAKLAVDQAARMLYRYNLYGLLSPSSTHRLHIVLLLRCSPSYWKEQSAYPVLILVGVCP